ncbi:MAG: glycosyltransferase family protein [Chthoniobacterales bacterium]
MAVAFHLPLHHRPDASRRRAWEVDTPVPVEAEGKTATAQAWIYQTWLHLSRAGADVHLLEDLPTEGVVVTLNGWLAPDFVAPRELFVAGVAADGRPHPGVDLQIVQNLWHARRLPSAVFMPHWPQPGLRSRNPLRGATMENVCFFGDPKNLAGELRNQTWQQKLFSASGARFELRGVESWHDYREVDAVVAVRGFAAARQPHKPATKLYNAWLAEVPFIGGADSAYRSEASPGIDYLLASSPDEVIDLVVKLRDEPEWREKIVERGRQRAEHLHRERLTERWRKLLSAMEDRRAKKIRKTKLRLAVGHLVKEVLYRADSLRRRD